MNSIKSTRGLLKELSHTQNGEPYIFPKAQSKRIEFYITQALICAEWGCTLRGTSLKPEEKKQAIYLGAATPLIDDLMDESQLSSTEIIAWLEQQAGSSKEKKATIISYLYEKLTAIKNSHFSEAMQIALKAQDNSVKQVQKEKIDIYELKRLTAAKGGTATLLYRTALNNPLKDTEKDAFMALGYVLQQINDLFDIYKDAKNKHHTLFTTTTDFVKNKDEFDQSISRMIHLFQKLDYTPENIEQCLLKISVVTSRGSVCFDQLLALKKKSTPTFELSNFSRKELICDMEKPANLLSSFKHSMLFYDKMKSHETNS